MSKRIAFFGDSFVGNYNGWIKKLCIENEYECVHIGKNGSDNLYPFEQWKKFNENYNHYVDICVYAHTECHRLYNRHPKVGLNSSTSFNTVSAEWVAKGYISNDYLKAVRDYYRFVLDDNEADMKSTLIPLGVDRYMNENNNLFEKIIHIWSFAQQRIYPPNTPSSVSATAKSIWNMDIISGANIVLDLSNLSAVDPDINVVNGMCQRPLHFSSTATPFVCELLETAIAFYKKGLVIDFRPYVDERSVWNDYIEAFKKIKHGL
jgi:hypothetical protein